MTIEGKALELMLALPLRKLRSQEKYNRASDLIEAAIRQARAEALEEAAQLAYDEPFAHPAAIADAIRALKSEGGSA